MTATEARTPSARAKTQTTPAETATQRGSQLLGALALIGVIFLALAVQVLNRKQQEMAKQLTRAPTEDDLRAWMQKGSYGAPAAPLANIVERASALFQAVPRPAQRPQPHAAAPAPRRVEVLEERKMAPRENVSPASTSASESDPDAADATAVSAPPAPTPEARTDTSPPAADAERPAEPPAEQ